MAELAEAPDWTPWGRPRRGERGVETAYHHPLILVRARRGGAARVVSPGEAFVGGDPEQIEWSPMPWALRGRRQWRSPGGLGPGKVFRGENERLFLFADALCEQLFEGGLLGPRNLDGWMEALKRRIAWCEARGIAYRQLVIPEGPAIAAGEMPGAPKLASDRPLMEILRRGGDPLRERFVYPLAALIEGRAKWETSHPHDVHLTGYGCFLCYRALVATLPRIDASRVVREDELRVRQILMAGDVARSCGLPPRRVDLHEPPHVHYRSVVKGTSYKSNQVDVFETDDASLPRLVMFRTSNATHLFPYLLRHFSRIAAVATTNVHYDLIESEKPDVVLCEAPERYFAPIQTSVNEMDRAGPPIDSDDRFTEKTGYPLPLPRGAGEAA